MEMIAKTMKNDDRVKPFVKWVGGKGQLLPVLDAALPEGFGEWKDVTYVEPFVGGGAMLFHMLRTYPNIGKVVINDLNANLINCYRIVRDKPNELIEVLRGFRDEYWMLENMLTKKDWYLARRNEYNAGIEDDVLRAAYFMALNRTCYNGMYRVNRKGGFNVPFGRAYRPEICYTNTILEDSRMLQNVEMLTGDYQETLKFAGPDTLFYFDPPYRPRSETSNFNTYEKEPFDDKAQERLKCFCDEIDDMGAKFMLSNSDCPDGFFDRLYENYGMERVMASRMVNANPEGRGKITEILVKNY